MKKGTKKIAIIITLLAIMLIVIPQTVQAIDFDVGVIQKHINNSEADTITNKYGEVIGTLTTIGSFASVIALIVLGIKYMTSSMDERAEYKQRMGAYLLGAIFVFAISTVISVIQEIGATITQSGGIEEAGQRIVTIISVIGSIVSVVILVILGIKYMGGSLEEKSDYKKSMLPYLIGAILVFAASQIAEMVYKLANGL